jgi:predicted membrane protein
MWWGPGRTLDWSVSLNETIPLSLDLQTGANEARIDLSSLQVTDLLLQTGASSTQVTLPTNASHTKAVIRSGAASVSVRVPSGVAARIKAQGGLADIRVDRSRFPRVGSVYESENYASAENRVDIDIETGVGSVDVR